MVKVIRLLQPTSFVIYHIVVQYLDIIVTDGEDKFYLSMITAVSYTHLTLPTNREV